MKIIDIDVKYILLFIAEYSTLLMSDVVVIAVHLLFMFNLKLNIRHL